MLDKLSVVACDFQTFMDGRSFSQARILREHIEFSGDIRAVGHFIGIRWLSRSSSYISYLSYQ